MPLSWLHQLRTYDKKEIQSVENGCDTPLSKRDAELA